MVAKALKDAAVRLGLFPNIFFCFNPFKIYEFYEIEKALGMSGGETVLDIGCGLGIQTMLLGRRCKGIVGIDVDENVIKRNGGRVERISKILKRPGNVEFRCTRVEDGKFDDESFDAVVSICMLEHVANCEETLREAHRVLKKGGKLVISVDSLENISDGKIREKHRMAYSIVKYFTAEGLKNLLESAGFREVEVRPLFVSEYADRHFSRYVMKGEPYGLIQSILDYHPLGYEEHKSRGRGKGIFLVAVCRK